MLPLVLAKVLGVSHFDTVGNYKEIFPVLRFCLDYPNPSDYASPKETVCFYLKKKSCRNFKRLTIPFSGFFFNLLK